MLPSFLSIQSTSDQSTNMDDGRGAASAGQMVENGTGDRMAKRVLRKIDRRLIPLLFMTYMFNFMDKTILSSASVFGLRDDTVSR
jgi:hypothetical protein